MPADKQLEEATLKLKAIIQEALQSAKAEIKVAQKDIVRSLEQQVQTARDEFLQDRDDFIVSFRQKMAEQLEQATQRFEQRADAAVNRVKADADRNRQRAGVDMDQKQKLFPDRPQLAIDQINALRTQPFTAEQCLQFLAEVVTKLPGTDDIIIPANYLYYELAKIAGVIRQ